MESNCGKLSSPSDVKLKINRKKYIDSRHEKEDDVAQRSKQKFRK